MNNRQIDNLIRTREEQFRDTELSQELVQLEYAIRNVESVAMELRQIFLRTIFAEGTLSWVEQQGNKHLRELNNFEKELFNLDICYENSVMSISFPELMPHRKMRPDVLYDEAVCECLRAFAIHNEMEFEEFQKTIKDGAVIVVKHSYKTRMLVRDNENVELKRIVDILVQTGFLIQDKGHYLDMYLTAECVETDQSYSTIYIMSKCKFKQFLGTIY